MMLRLFLFVVALMLANPALARDLTGHEKQALADLVSRYEVAVLEKNYAALGATIPPRVLERYVAARGSPDLERHLWIYLFAADSKAIERQVGTVTETFKLDHGNARFSEAPDGTPYAVMTSTSVVTLKNGDRLEVTSPYLALMDEGEWYLINVGFGGLMGSVKGLYPSFDEIKFDHATQLKL